MSDAGVYHAEIYDPKWKEETLVKTTSCTVTINEVPMAPRITKDIPATRELSGNEILLLEVDADHWHKNTDKIRWYRDDVELTSRESETWDTTNLIIYAESSLKLGTFQAKFTNEVGTTESTKCVVTSK